MMTLASCSSPPHRPAQAILLLAAVFAASSMFAAPPVKVSPSSLPRVGTVDERFQSFNIEMVEVTGGRFWKSYKEIDADRQAAAAASAPPSGATPAGLSADLFQYRPPVDLSSPRLRKLAAALAPSYMRVSGTWANTTYFPAAGSPAPKTPPTGFGGVLTREQWRQVVELSRAANAPLITSFAAGDGVRNDAGVWTPAQASQIIAYTKTLGGTIAAAEFMNEPNLAAMGGAPKGYDAAAYARDTALFRTFLKQASPNTIFLGPGSVAEGGALSGATPSGMLASESLLKATGPVYDAFSYHLYAAVSKRCAGMGASGQTTEADALKPEWLSRPDKIAAFYKDLRDRFEPGKPLWITETADTACGGNAWGATFLDTFRYLDQHGRLAQQGVQVIAHNTLAASDYGLLDEHTFAPRPNYWGALLWRKLMGHTVLKTESAPDRNLYVYAHCLRGTPGGVALLAINTDRTASQTLEVPGATARYTLTAPSLTGTRVDLNGKLLELGAGDALPALTSAPVKPGPVQLDPVSITFLAVSGANNPACRE